MSRFTWIAIVIVMHCASLVFAGEALQPIPSSAPSGCTSTIGFEQEFPMYSLVVVDHSAKPASVSKMSEYVFTDVIPGVESHSVAKSVAAEGPLGQSALDITWDLEIESMGSSELELVTGPFGATVDAQKKALEEVVRFVSAIHQGDLLKPVKARTPSQSSKTDKGFPLVAEYLKSIANDVSAIFLDAVIEKYNAGLPKGSPFALEPRPVKEGIKILILYNSKTAKNYASQQVNFAMPVRNFGLDDKFKIYRTDIDGMSMTDESAVKTLNLLDSIYKQGIDPFFNDIPATFTEEDRTMLKAYVVLFRYNLAMYWKQYFQNYKGPAQCKNAYGIMPKLGAGKYLLSSLSEQVLKYVVEWAKKQDDSQQKKLMCGMYEDVVIAAKERARKAVESSMTIQTLSENIEKARKSLSGYDPQKPKYADLKKKLEQKENTLKEDTQKVQQKFTGTAEVLFAAKVAAECPVAFFTELTEDPKLDVNPDRPNNPAKASCLVKVVPPIGSGYDAKMVAEARAGATKSLIMKGFRLTKSATWDLPAPADLTKSIDEICKLQ